MVWAMLGSDVDLILPRQHLHPHQDPELRQHLQCREQKWGWSMPVRCLFYLCPFILKLFWPEPRDGAASLSITNASHLLCMDGEQEGR